MKTTVRFTVNGKSQEVTTDAKRTLLDVLREDLDLTGTKYGCGEGQCRACTVLMDGNPVRSCQTEISEASGRKIGEPPKPKPGALPMYKEPARPLEIR